MPQKMPGSESTGSGLPRVLNFGPHLSAQGATTGMAAKSIDLSTLQLSGNAQHW